MLNGMIRMKEMIQKLKEYGYLGHLESEYTQRCSSKHLEQLNEMTQDLEITLVGWIKYVWNCRHKYYQLNFYTTKQLITLRKEITQIRDDKSKEINPHVFYLLQSVIGKPEKSSMLLRKALENEEVDISEKEKENIIPQAESEEIIDDESDVEATFLQKGIHSLNKEQTELFEQLSKNCYHSDPLLLEAVLNPDCCCDFLTAMMWCNEKACDDEFMEEIQYKWKVNTTNENISEQIMQPSLEQPSLEDESFIDNANFSVIVDAFIPFKHDSTVDQTRFVSTFSTK